MGRGWNPAPSTTGGRNFRTGEARTKGGLKCVPSFRTQNKTFNSTIVGTKLSSWNAANGKTAWGRKRFGQGEKTRERGKGRFSFFFRSETQSPCFTIGQSSSTKRHFLKFGPSPRMEFPLPHVWMLLSFPLNMYAIENINIDVRKKRHAFTGGKN